MCRSESKYTKATGLALNFLVLVACVSFTLASPAREKESDRTRTISFDTNQFTQSSISVSPDGKTLLFDVLGNLYTVPILGGHATQITHGSAWNMQPKYAPDGEKISYISDRGGVFELWISSIDDTGATEYPNIYDQQARRYIDWTPDGRLMASIDRQNGSWELRAWTSPSASETFVDAGKALPLAFAAISSDSKYAYFGGNGLFRKDLHTGEIRSLDSRRTEKDAYFTKLRISEDGNVLTYFKRTAARTAKASEKTCTLHMLDIRTGSETILGDSRRSCLTVGRLDYDIPDYALLRDGSAVIINDKGKIARFDLRSARRAELPVTVSISRTSVQPIASRPNAALSPQIRGRVIRWPSLSKDSSKVAFTAFSRLYVMNRGTAETTRLTTGTVAENAPVISPDGKWVAYTTWSDSDMGHLMISPIGGGNPRKLTVEAGRYTNPVWSSDGRKLAYISDSNTATYNESAKYDQREIWLHVVSLEAHGSPRGISRIMPLHWQYRRFYPSPTFLEGDSRLVFATTQQTDDDSHYPEIVIKSVGLDGRDPRIHYQIPNVDEVVASPDGSSLAAVTRGKLYVLPASLSGSNVVARAIEFREDFQVPGVEPVYVKWTDENDLIWAEGTELITYNLSTKVRNKIADIKVELPRAKPTGCIALKNARLLTMRAGGAIEEGTIEICGDRIVSIGPTDSLNLREDVRIIDARGKTIIPGLVDTHAHMGYGNAEVWPRNEETYLSYLAYGITSVYDPQSSLLDQFGRGEMVDIGEGVGPRIYASGPGIMGENEGDQTYFHMRPAIRTMAQAREVVLARSRYGAGPLKSYDDGSRARRRMLAKAAREHGISVTSHPSTFENALASIGDGISVEHSLSIGRNISINDDVLEYIAASGVSYTIESIGAGKYPVDKDDPKLKRLLSTEALEKVFGDAPEYYPFLRKPEAQSIARLDELGGLATIGAHGSFVPGLATHHDLWALVDLGGMKPYAALKVATLNGAMKLGMGTESGTLEPGKLADLIVLNSDPRERIQNSIDIQYVMRGGLMYDGRDMTEVWPNYRPLPPWRWQGVPGSSSSSPTSANKLTKH